MAVYKFPYRNSSTEHGMLRIRMGRAAGYAQPSKPIQVTMVGDEEQLSETHSAASVKVMMPPPAYGRWRGSIVSKRHPTPSIEIIPLIRMQRLNPDLLFWQRIDNQSSVLQSNARGQEDAASKTGEPQPPSYLPNMGVNHVAEAKPRPVTEYPQG
ncbi:hypothetical protein BJX63DRAFT_409053 [Aspergillus granulosus]|uniref:Uncharacterized protein n=1 Tax=Aspergillus granulosus TaxID=176169 RepID=A0ABR4GZ70_9EURO